MSSVKELEARIEKLENLLELTWEEIEIEVTGKPRIGTGHWAEIARKGYVDRAILKLHANVVCPLIDRISKLETKDFSDHPINKGWVSIRGVTSWMPLPQPLKDSDHE